MLSPQLIESLVEGIVGVIIIALRIFSRSTMVGFRGWKGDDYLIIVGLFITAAGGVSVYSRFTESKQSVSYSAQEVLTDDQVRKAIEDGAVWNLVSWLTYTADMWVLKGAMLFFYMRVGENLVSTLRIKVYGGIVVATYIAILIALLTQCHPFVKNWAVRYDTKQCSRRSIVPIFLTVGILNVMTDVLLLTIPIPLLWRARFSMARKIRVGTLLCGGIFVIIVAITRTVLVIRGNLLFENNPEVKYNAGEATMLAAREMFVANVVVNAPFLTAVFRRRFWNVYFGKRDVQELDIERGPRSGKSRKVSNNSSSNRSLSPTETIVVGFNGPEDGMPTPMPSTPAVQEHRKTQSYSTYGSDFSFRSASVSSDNFHPLPLAPPPLSLSPIRI